MKLNKRKILLLRTIEIRETIDSWYRRYDALAARRRAALDPPFWIKAVIACLLLLQIVLFAFCDASGVWRYLPGITCIALISLYPVRAYLWTYRPLSQEMVEICVRVNGMRHNLFEAERERSFLEKQDRRWKRGYDADPGLFS